MGLAGVECRGWWGVEVSMKVSQEHRSVRWSQVGVLLFEEGETYRKTGLTCLPAAHPPQFHPHLSSGSQ